jgi:hypothetical protein
MSEPSYPLRNAAVIERRGLRDRVYDLVLDMLVGQQVAPGTCLSIDAIARDQGVSDARTGSTGPAGANGTRHPGTA